MPDVHDLLRLGAAAPSAPLDVAAVASRAGVLQRRRTAARTGAVGALAALLVVAGLQLTAGAGSEPLQLDEIGPATPPASVAQTPAARRPTPPAAQAQTAPRDPSQVAAPGAGPAQPAAAPAAVPPPALRPSAQPSTRPSAVGRPASGDYPRASGCRVTTEGALPGETRTCRFTASADGGYDARYRGGAGIDFPEYEVVVERDGRRSVHEQSCGNGVILPGDRVTVSVTNSAQGVDFFELAAGAGVGC